MKLGIKFCGGCNPRYDRREAVEVFLNQNPQWDPVSADRDDLAGVLVVCGCSSRCASHQGLTGKYGKWIVSSPEDLESLSDEMKDIPIECG